MTKNQHLTSEKPIKEQAAESQPVTGQYKENKEEKDDSWQEHEEVKSKNIKPKHAQVKKDKNLDNKEWDENN